MQSFLSGLSFGMGGQGTQKHTDSISFSLLVNRQRGLQYCQVSVESQQLLAVQVLTDVKLILVRFLVIKIHFDNLYYNTDFETLRSWALKQSLRSRGLSKKAFEEVLTFLRHSNNDSDSQWALSELDKRVNVGLRDLFDRIEDGQAVDLDEVEQLLPSDDVSQIGSFPSIPENYMLPFVDLVYMVTQAHQIEWTTSYSVSDFSLVSDCLHACNKVFEIEDLSYYDPLNLFHTNFCRVLVHQPEDFILKLTSIRIDHIMVGFDNTDWEIDETLEDCLPDRLRGCSNFLIKRLQKYKADSKYATKATFMNEGDYTDARELLGPSCQFKVQDELMQINNKSLYSSIDKFCLFNAKQSGGKRAPRNEQAQRQLVKFRRVHTQFMKLAAAKIAFITQRLRLQVLNNLVSFTHEAEQSMESYFNEMRQAIRSQAILACDVDREVGKSEFVLYQMKFVNNSLLTRQLDWLEALIGHAEVFSAASRFNDQEHCPFNSLLLQCFENKNQLLSGKTLYQVYELAEKFLKEERQRIKDCRNNLNQSLEIRTDPHYPKEDDTVFKINAVFEKALKAILPAFTCRPGISPSDYVILSLYYSVEPLPESFILKQSVADESANGP